MANPCGVGRSLPDPEPIPIQKYRNPGKTRAICRFDQETDEFEGPGHYREARNPCLQPPFMFGFPIPRWSFRLTVVARFYLEWICRTPPAVEANQFRISRRRGQLPAAFEVTDDFAGRVSVGIDQDRNIAPEGFLQVLK